MKNIGSKLLPSKNYILYWLLHFFMPSFVLYVWQSALLNITIQNMFSFRCQFHLNWIRRLSHYSELKTETFFETLNERGIWCKLHVGREKILGYQLHVLLLMLRTTLVQREVNIADDFTHSVTDNKKDLELKALTLDFKPIKFKVRWPVLSLNEV